MAMKAPAKPPSVKDILSRRSSEAASSLADDKVMSLVRSFDQRYLHWSEVRLRKMTADPEIVWALMKRGREMSYHEMTAAPIALRFNLTSQAISWLASFDAVAMERDQRFLRSSDVPVSVFLTEEAISSSQMEGAFTTRDVARRMLMEGRRPRDRSERMIYNNYQAMRTIGRLLHSELTMASLNELHRTITSGTLDDPSLEGRPRTKDDIVVSDPLDGTVYHHPPSSSSLPDLLEDLISFFNRPPDTHPLVAAMAIHYLVGYIHPYHDGNGRLARALMYWYGLREGYWFLQYLAVSKAIRSSKGRYGTAYLHSETDGNDITYFLNYNLECMSKALQEAIDGLESRRSKNEEAVIMSLKDPRLDIRQAKVLGHVRTVKRPVSINEVKSEFGVVYQTARTDLLSLRDMGFLEMRVQGRKMLFMSR